MAGFNFVPPPGPMPPIQNLQQAALAAFRPPPPMSMGGGMGTPGMQAPQQAGGFGAAQGAGMLSGALSGFKGWGGGDIPTPQSQGISVGQMGNGSFPNFNDTGFQPAYDFLNGGFSSSGTSP
jgi:hypothetical protein